MCIIKLNEMKIFRNILIFSVAVILAVACNEGIDPITPVEPGPDELAPTAAITSPTEGTLLKIEEGFDVPIFMEAVDDIELQSVSIILDGNEIENITSFTDYRRYAPIEGHLLDMEDGSHKIKINATDLTGKSTSSEEIAFSTVTISEFVPQYGELFYMSFDKHFFEFASLTDATVVGFPGFDNGGKVGSAYKGAADSYLTFPTEGLMLGEEFSASMWYNLNVESGRSGILTIGPPDGDKTDKMNNRTSGFRLFREGGATDQTIKLNVGNGTADAWFDGGDAAKLNPEVVDWVHIAFTISADHVAVYIDGVVVSEGALEGPVGWDGCDILSIASGEPRFSEWDHKWDGSMYDELRIFNKALTQ